MRPYHRVRRFSRIVGENHEIDVARPDLPLGQHPSLQPPYEARPVRPAEENHRELIDLPGLDQRHRLEQLVERTETARKDDERNGVLDEHRLPHEEIAELNQGIDVWIRSLLERQLDVASNRPAAAEACALIRRFHDPGPGSGDYREAAFSENAGCFLRRRVVRIVGWDPYRSEYRHSLFHCRQRVEPLDEL